MQNRESDTVKEPAYMSKLFLPESNYKILKMKCFSLISHEKRSYFSLRVSIDLNSICLCLGISFFVILNKINK